MREFGLDGIAVSSDGVYHGIQAKCRNNKLCACDIGSFIAVSKGRFEKNNPLSRGYLYHTTTIQHDLWNDLQCMDNIIVQHLPYCNDSNQLLDFLVDVETSISEYEMEEAMTQIKIPANADPSGGLTAAAEEPGNVRG